MNSLPVFLSFSFSYLSFLMRNPQCGLVNHIGDFSDVNSKEPLNKSSAAERRIFYTNRAVRKMENTYSIPSFFVLSLGAKSLAVSSCRFNQSFPSFPGFQSKKIRTNHPAQTKKEIALRVMLWYTEIVWAKS